MKIIIIIVGVLFLVALVEEIYYYIQHWKETGESYLLYRKEVQQEKRQLKRMKEMSKMINDVYSMTDEELNKAKDKINDR